MVLFFSAGGADLPVSTIDRCQKRSVALKTPEIPAGKTESYSGIVEIFDLSAMNSIVTAAVRALSDGYLPLLPISSLFVYLKGHLEGLLNGNR